KYSDKDPSEEEDMEAYHCFIECVSKGTQVADDTGYVNLESMVKHRSSMFEKDEINEFVKKWFSQCVKEGNECAQNIQNKKKGSVKCNPAEEYVRLCLDFHATKECPEHLKTHDEVCNEIATEKTWDPHGECNP
ncbi:hypothetical protein L9F63_022437, partial [Diploptera punctata]